MEYSIERFSESHIPALANLYNLCFRKNISPDWFRQKYDTDNLGVKYIGFLALDQNKVAAFYGVIPCLVALEGQDILAAQSADTMTHPDHRNKGLFFTLARKTYELAGELNIRFLFGFPNQHSLPGAVKLGWDFSLPPMKLFQLKLRSLPYARLIFKSKLLSQVYLNVTRLTLGSDRGKAHGILPEQRNGPKHDAAFISYKKYSPAFFITINQTDIWVRLDGDMKIGLLTIPPESDPRPLLTKLKRLATILGCGQVVFITSHNTSLYKNLSLYIQPVDAFPTGIFKLTDDERLPYELISFEYCDLDIF